MLGLWLAMPEVVLPPETPENRDNPAFKHTLEVCRSFERNLGFDLDEIAFFNHPEARYSWNGTDHIWERLSETGCLCRLVITPGDSLRCDALSPFFCEVESHLRGFLLRDGSEMSLRLVASHYQHYQHQWLRWHRSEQATTFVNSIGYVLVDSLNAGSRLTFDDGVNPPFDAWWDESGHGELFQNHGWTPTGKW